MAREQQRRGHEPYSELAAGFALYALDDNDLARFEAHLAGCEQCATDVAAYERSASVVFATSAEPPAGLREAILDNGSRGASGAVAALRPRRRMAPWVVSAAASVAAVALAVTNASLREDVDTSRATLARTSRVVECAATPGCRTVPLAGEGRRAFGVVVVDAGRATLVVDKLAPNDRAQETYVLWQIRPGGAPVALSVFDVPSAALTVLDPVVVPASGSPGMSFAVSIEPGRQAPPAPTRPVLTPVT